MALQEAILWGLHQFTCWGVLATDANLNVTGWNRWLETHTARAAADVMGRNLLEVFPELAGRQVERFYRQALGGHVVLLSQRLHKFLIRMPPSEPDSAFAEMRQSVRIAPLVDGEQVLGTLTLIEDVTERVSYEEELGARARQQAALAALGQRALAGGDLSALMNEVATVCVQTLAVDYGDVLELLPGGQHVRVRAATGWPTVPGQSEEFAVGPDSLLARVLQASRSVAIDDLTGDPRLHARGAVSGAAIRIAVRQGPFGVLGVYAASRRRFSDDQLQFLQATADVLGMAVERKLLEETLRNRVADLAESDRRKNEFLAMLGHELRNPLAPIRNATQVLRLKPATDPDLGWAGDVIERQVEHMTRLIDDLLDVARITRGKINFHKEPIELAAVIARAVETSRPLIDARRQQLTLTLPSEPLRLLADSARLAQVIGNLLNNAAKYTPDGGSIWLTAQQEGDELVVSVRDTGVGIAAEILPAIFDLFTQADRSLDRSEGGLGIGLTLARSLVTLHGGRIEAFSSGPGQGSEFVMHLPALPASTPVTSGAAASELEAVPQCGLRRILVVDDNIDSADSLALLLRLHGHKVLTAYDGPSALEMARAFSPEVILLDIGLPGMSGTEVGRLLRNDLMLVDAVIIAMTGYGQEEDRRRSEDAGFDAHLLKPVDLENLTVLLSYRRGPHRSTSDG